MTVRRSARRTAAWLAGLATGLALGGCANLPFPSSASPAASATPGAAPAASPERADYQLDIVAPDTLRTLLLAYLDLARFQNAPATEGISNAELDRLMAAAPAQARSLLETEGYFNAEVQVERVASESGKPRLRMRVESGPQASVGAVTIDANGAFGAALQAGDATAARELALLRRLWALPAGRPFRQSTWSAAKNATLGRLRADGYPAAAWSATQATVDADAGSVRLALTAESGPLYRLGDIRVDGLARYDENVVRRLATFSPGTPYSEQLLLDFQERLQKVGLFEGVVVELDPSEDTASAAPVRVRVKELPLQQATFGVGYSANTGPRLSVEHTHRRVFGSRWIAKNKLELGPNLKSWQGDLTSHPLDGLYRNLVSGSAERLRSTEEVRSAWSARLGRTQDTPRIERLYYAEIAHARVDSSTYNTSGDAVSGNYHWTFRELDSVLLPTRGITLSAQATLGYSRGRQTIFDGAELSEGSGPFGRGYGRLTWYRPFASKWYATLRVEAGEVVTRQVIGVPDTLLFRAGGDDSVRGYGYRSLGPQVGGVVRSGRVLLTGSAEAATPISARYPAFWWAAFIDAGNAADTWKELRPALGYGVGLRWRSPVGPLRLDLAYGQKVRQARVHLSVGIAF